MAGQIDIAGEHGCPAELTLPACAVGIGGDEALPREQGCIDVRRGTGDLRELEEETGPLIERIRIVPRPPAQLTNLQIAAELARMNPAVSALLMERLLYHGAGHDLAPCAGGA